MLGFSTLGVVSNSQLNLVGILGSQNKKFMNQENPPKKKKKIIKTEFNYQMFILFFSKHCKTFNIFLIFSY